MAKNQNLQRSVWCTVSTFFGKVIIQKKSQVTVFEHTCAFARWAHALPSVFLSVTLSFDKIKNSRLENDGE